MASHDYDDIALAAGDGDCFDDEPYGAPEPGEASWLTRSRAGRARIERGEREAAAFVAQLLGA